MNYGAGRIKGSLAATASGHVKLYFHASCLTQREQELDSKYINGIKE